MKQYFYRGILIISISFVLTMPLFLTGLDVLSRYYLNRPIIYEPDLVGFMEETKDPGTTFVTISNGSWENYVEKKFADSLVPRKTITRIYNQILWSVFTSTDLPNVYIGKDRFMFEDAYINQFISEMDFGSVARLEAEVALLSELKTELAKIDVPLFIWLTPSKAVYYPEYLPDAFQRYRVMKQNGKYRKAEYQVFEELLQNSNIEVYSGKEILTNMINDNQPVFIAGGIHWTSVLNHDWVGFFPCPRYNKSLLVYWRHV